MGKVHRTEKKIIAVFDFDGTITIKDTFLDFARFVLPFARFWGGIVLFSPLLVMAVLKMTSGGKVKEKIFSFFFRGWALSRYQKAAQDYCDTHVDGLIRPAAKDCIEKHFDEGNKVVIVSASTKELIVPFGKWLGLDDKDILGTQIEVINGHLTGAFSGANCKREEKVRRLLEVFPERESYQLYAYGDSSGDKELLAFADKGFYREFE